jgi:hypothetical protein
VVAWADSDFGIRRVLRELLSTFIDKCIILVLEGLSTPFPQAIALMGREAASGLDSPVGKKRGIPLQEAAFLLSQVFPYEETFCLFNRLSFDEALFFS